MFIRLWGTNPVKDREFLDLVMKTARERGLSISGDYVDVLESVDRALLERILVTPTIDRIDPMPRIRLVALPENPATLLRHLAG